MGLLTTLAQSVARHLRHSDSATPVRFRSYRASGGYIFGPVPPTATTPNADGLELLQAQRLALLTEARRQKNLRRSKASSLCEAELRRVTHEILRSRIDV